MNYIHSLSLSGKYSKEGLSGTFIVDRNMTIKSLCVYKDQYIKLLRYSVLRLLSWMQRGPLLAKGVEGISRFFQRNILIDDKLHSSLLRYYLLCRDNKISEEIPIIPDSRHSSYSTADITSETIYICGKDVITLYVGVKTTYGVEYTPLICLSDL